MFQYLIVFRENGPSQGLAVKAADPLNLLWMTPFKRRVTFFRLACQHLYCRTSLFLQSLSRADFCNFPFVAFAPAPLRRHSTIRDLPFTLVPLPFGQASPTRSSRSPRGIKRVVVLRITTRSGNHVYGRSIVGTGVVFSHELRGTRSGSMRQREHSRLFCS